MTLPDNNTLFADIRALLQRARAAAHRQVNTLVVHTNFEIGRRIVLHEQGGASRAEYGREIVRSLSSRLTEEFGRGYSPDNLWLMRRFYLTYQDRLPKVETPSQLFIFPDGAPNSQTASGNLPSPDEGSISETPSGISALAPTRPFTLTWSHYVFLIGVQDPAERAFY